MRLLQGLYHSGEFSLASAWTPTPSNTSTPSLVLSSELLCIHFLPDCASSGPAPQPRLWLPPCFRIMVPQRFALTELLKGHLVQCFILKGPPLHLQQGVSQLPVAHSQFQASSLHASLFHLHTTQEFLPYASKAAFPSPHPQLIISSSNKT